MLEHGLWGIPPHQLTSRVTCQGPVFCSCPPSGPWSPTLRLPESATVGKPFNIPVVPGQVRELRSILQGDFPHTEDSRCEEGEKKVQDQDSAKVIQETMIQVQIVSVLLNINAPK